jgi:hypothetical protein
MFVVLHWSFTNLSRLWSFSLGRPFRVDSEEITVARPNSTAAFAVNNAWIQYPANPTELAINEATQPDNDMTSLVASQWVSLCEELAPLIRVLYVVPISLHMNRY